MTQFYLFRRSTDRIRQVSVYCHGNNFIMASKIFTSPVSLPTTPQTENGFNISLVCKPIHFVSGKVFDIVSLI